MFTGEARKNYRLGYFLGGALAPFRLPPWKTGGEKEAFFG